MNPADIPTSERREAAMAALQGTALGDAFGQSFEAHDAEALRRRALPGAVWRWSDDTAMAASITEALHRRGQIDQDALALSFARRYADDPARGYGALAHYILTRIGAGVPWATAAAEPYKGQGSMGNGAAMRVAPLGAYFFDDLERAAHEARRSAQVTHAHPEGQAGAVAVAVAAAWLRQQGNRGWSPGALLHAVAERVPEGKVLAGLRAALRVPAAWTPAEAAEILGDGGLITAPDTVPFALFSVDRCSDTFEDALFHAMAGLTAPGADRDTVCAIVGGLVASRLGHGGLPRDWLARREPLPAVRL